MRLLPLLFLVSLTSSALAAPAVIGLSDDWSLAVDAQIRPRLIVDSGRDFIDDKLIQREYVTQRSRLGVTLNKADGPSLTVRVQDVRIWGEEANTLDFSASGLDLH
ncbi:MAG: hypothetical protein KC620_18460, partial [Myxococcales bacterium]|nr:hypothetical protein [Myxococcales bacterium]